MEFFIFLGYGLSAVMCTALVAIKTTIDNILAWSKEITTNTNQLAKVVEEQRGHILQLSRENSHLTYANSQLSIDLAALVQRVDQLEQQTDRCRKIMRA